MQLKAVPSITQGDCTLKLTQQGVISLKKGRYRSRYTGSKTAVVDINGRLHLSRSEYKKFLKQEEQEREAYKLSLGIKPKKRARKNPGPDIQNLQLKEHEDTHNLSTSNFDLSTESGGLSTIPSKAQRKKEYSVNKREVRSRLLAMINSERGKKELYFWTVTFFAGTPDDIAYQIFNTWLTALRQKKMLRNYLWIAERQTGERLNDATKTPTNTIHFHIAIPHKMNVHRANRMMAGTLKTYARRGGVPWSEHQARRYNGVHISKNNKTGRVVNFAIKKGSRALGNYLTKYVTKNNEKFSHLAWHNSRGYSELFTGFTITFQEFRENEIWQLTNGKKMYEGDFFKFYPWAGDPPEPFLRHLYELNSFLQNQKN